MLGRGPEAALDGRQPEVVLADADRHSRVRLRAALAAGGFRVCAVPASGSAAIRAAMRTRPDLCLVDVALPGDGVLAAHEITRRLPATAVVMIATTESAHGVFEALHAGAVGYLRKDVAPASLAAALYGVLDGQAALPRVLMARVLDEFRGRSRRQRLRLARSGLVAELTVREWEVLELMRDGLATPEIAKRLFIEPVTVRTHVRSILKKLEVSDRDEALAQLTD